MVQHVIILLKAEVKASHEALQPGNMVWTYEDTTIPYFDHGYWGNTAIHGFESVIESSCSYPCFIEYYLSRRTLFWW